MQAPQHVHLVGSIGLDNVPEIFRTLGTVLGRRLKRVPDGEVGGRRLWVSWQYPLFRASPFFAATEVARPRTGFLELRIANGVDPKDIVFGELGYAREARASYLDFIRAKDGRELPQDVRFQVCLPTPLAVVSSFCAAQDGAAIESAYERAMVAEVASVCEAIPHHDLAIQWDVCHEMVFWDGQDFSGRIKRTDVTNASILERMRRICGAVPPDVELGIHLCYGDFDAKHFVEPRDAAKMVEFANALSEAIAHPLAFVHMPVPIGRTDDAYFRPLRDLKLPPTTEVYLGVVHAADGKDGTDKRIAAAARHISGFGIACECGIARARRPNLVATILSIHAQSSREP
jgi:hypothetical protein